MENELITKESEGNFPLNIETLHVSPIPQIHINLGDEQSFLKMAGQLTDITGVIWNEEKITLMGQDRTKTIQFYPEIETTAKLFLVKEEPRRRRDNIFGIPTGPKVWEGEFEPIIFPKGKLIEFLQQYHDGLSDDIISSIKNMRVTERRSEQEEMITLDESETRTVIEESNTTNIPKNFTLALPVSGSYVGHFDFEASVAMLEDDYGHKTKRKGIMLRCLNGRDVLRDMMLCTLSQLPPELPIYYGAMGVEMRERNAFL